MKIPVIGAVVAAATAAPVAMMLYVPPAAMRNSAIFVPDPLIWAGERTPAYGKSVTTLLDAQRSLTKSEAALQEATHCFTLLRSGRRNRAPSRCRHLSLTAAAVRVKRARLHVLRARKQVAAAEDAIEENRDAAAAPAVPVEQGTVLVLFRDGLPIDEHRDVLRRHGLIERSRLTNLLYVTHIVSASPSRTAEGLATRVRALVESLEQEASVKAAVQNVLLGSSITEVIDPPVVEDFPAASDENEAVSRGQTPIDVGVLDIGFTLHKPKDLDIEIVCQPRVVEDHGTIVASIIGAKSGNDEGIDGAAPFARLQGCAPKLRELEPTDLVDAAKADLPIVKRKVAFDAYLDGLETLLSRNVRVVNASIGYNWGKFLIRPSTDQRVQEMVERQGMMVQEVLRNHSDVIVVSAAGNDCRQVKPCDPAMWTSPINWAGLNPEARAENVIVVQGLDHQCNDLDMSNVEGMIAAIAENVPAITEVKEVGGSIQDVVGTCPTGTSCAAPLVTAAVAQMLSVNPGLAPSQIKRQLGIGTGIPELQPCGPGR